FDDVAERKPRTREQKSRAALRLAIERRHGHVFLAQAHEHADRTPAAHDVVGRRVLPDDESLGHLRIVLFAAYRESEPERIEHARGLTKIEVLQIGHARFGATVHPARHHDLVEECQAGEEGGDGDESRGEEWTQRVEPGGATWRRRRFGLGHERDGLGLRDRRLGGLERIVRAFPAAAARHALSLRVKRAANEPSVPCTCGRHRRNPSRDTTSAGRTSCASKTVNSGCVSRKRCTTAVVSSGSNEHTLYTRVPPGRTALAPASRSSSCTL